ncbi:MAG: FliH/SctL family protein [Novosphingobium sp.]|nr:FliH/SctL family protein [Novosphingobium sp.]
MPHLALEVFHDHPEPAPDSAAATLADEARLAGFDAGYAAGWDDAAAAHAGERAQTEARTAEAVQALGFTYQEARNHVLTALEPLLMEIVSKLLPRIAQAALPALVVETILPLAENLSEPPVTLRLNPASRAAIEQLCVPALGLPVSIVEDDSLTPGDIRLTLDQGEARIDLDSAIDQISAALDDFFTPNTKAQAHG